MKSYKHWLKISWRVSGSKEWHELRNYIENYPNSKITVFNPVYGNIFTKFFCLECDQSYNDLDLACNTMSNNLIHLERKPANLEPSKRSFEALYKIYTRSDKEVSNG